MPVFYIFLNAVCIIIISIIISFYTKVYQVSEHYNDNNILYAIQINSLIVIALCILCTNNNHNVHILHTFWPLR